MDSPFKYKICTLIKQYDLKLQVTTRLGAIVLSFN